MFPRLGVQFFHFCALINEPSKIVSNGDHASSQCVYVIGITFSSLNTVLVSLFLPPILQQVLHSPADILYKPRLVDDLDAHLKILFVRHEVY
jgi:hypothetical protein